MKLTQISVFLENKEGRLYDLCDLLGDHDINIRALNIAETADYGILRMVVDDPRKAVRILQEHQVVTNLTEVVAVEVADRPGGLAAVLRAIRESGLNVEYMYGFFEKKTANALLVFRFDDPDRAVEALESRGIRTCPADTLRS